MAATFSDLLLRRRLETRSFQPACRLRGAVCCEVPESDAGVAAGFRLWLVLAVRAPEIPQAEGQLEVRQREVIYYAAANA